MKNQNLNITEIYNNLVGQTNGKNSTRVVNGTEYFFSKWSQSWHPVSERSGSHNYTAKEVAIWSRIYNAVPKLRAQAYELEKAGQTAEAKELLSQANQLWEAKGNCPELYKEVAGLTTEQLDALEKDLSEKKVAKAK